MCLYLYQTPVSDDTFAKTPKLELSIKEESETSHQLTVT
jgi:hypothetical protein